MTWLAPRLNLPWVCPLQCRDLYSVKLYSNFKSINAERISDIQDLVCFISLLAYGCTGKNSYLFTFVLFRRHSTNKGTRSTLIRVIILPIIEFFTAFTSTLNLSTSRLRITNGEALAKLLLRYYWLSLSLICSFVLNLHILFSTRNLKLITQLCVPLCCLS